MEKITKKLKRRDEMHRCQWCKKIFNDEDCVLDPIKGYICPNGCEAPFNQPPYEGPYQDETTLPENRKEMQQL